MNIYWAFTLYHLIHSKEYCKLSIAFLIFTRGIWDSQWLIHLPGIIKLFSNDPSIWKWAYLIPKCMFFLPNPAGKTMLPILYNFYSQNLCSLNIVISSISVHPGPQLRAIFIHFSECFSSTPASSLQLWLCLDSVPGHNFLIPLFFATQLNLQSSLMVPSFYLTTPAPITSSCFASLVPVINSKHILLQLMSCFKMSSSYLYR